MKRTRAGSTDVEPHVFDQTNGLVDQGGQQPNEGDDPDLRNRTIAGAAMLFLQRP